MYDSTAKRSIGTKVRLLSKDESPQTIQKSDFLQGSHGCDMNPYSKGRSADCPMNDLAKYTGRLAKAVADGEVALDVASLVACLLIDLFVFPC
jgi:hypothetical protein